jgi:hypothetical protein
MTSSPSSGIAGSGRGASGSAQGSRIARVPIPSTALESRTTLALAADPDLRHLRSFALTGRVLLDSFAQLTAEPIDASGAGADRRTRREYECIFMRPGRVRRADGEASNWLIPPEAIEAAVDKFDAVPSYLDHLSFFDEAPKVERLVGITFDPFWSEEEEALMGYLRLYDEEPGSPGGFVGALFDQILADKAAGRDVPPTGLSAVFFHHSTLDKESGLRITTDFRHVESVDVVYAPGAGGYIRAALASAGTPRPNDGVGMSRPRILYPVTLPATGRSPESPTHSQGDAIMEDETPTPQPELAADAPTHAATTPVAQPPGTGDTPPVGPAARPVNSGVSSGEPSPPAEPPQPPVGPAALGGVAHPAAFGGAAAPATGALDAHLAQLYAELARQRETVERLSQLLARREEDSTVQNMGQAPRGQVGQFSFGLTGLEQIQQAWDWVFDVPDAPTPPPDLRNTANLYRLITGDVEFTGRFDPRASLAAANVTTLSDMVVSAMNKVMMRKFERMRAYRWYEPLVVVQPNDGTLHDMVWITFGGISNLPTIADGGPYTELEVADVKETDSFTKYGGYVGVTEKVIRNSDIARMRAIPHELVVAAISTRSAAIAAIFTSNTGVGPTLDQDSVALFHTASHGNLATTAFSWAAWKAAGIECYKQTELGSSKRQGLWPKFCLVPADLYDEALIVFGYGQGPGGKPGEGTTTSFQDVNPFGISRPGDPRPVVVAVPDFTDTNDWAYLADPEVAPIIQMSYDGQPGGGRHVPPQVLTVTSPTAGLMFSNDVMPIRVKDQFAYGVSTYRGIGKRNVA